MEDLAISFRVWVELLQLFVLASEIRFREVVSREGAQRRWCRSWLD